MNKGSEDRIWNNQSLALTDKSDDFLGNRILVILALMTCTFCRCVCVCVCVVKLQSTDQSCECPWTDGTCRASLVSTHLSPYIYGFHGLDSHGDTLAAVTVTRYYLWRIYLGIFSLRFLGGVLVPLEVQNTNTSWYKVANWIGHLPSQSDDVCFMAKMHTIIEILRTCEIKMQWIKPLHPPFN